MYDGADTLSLGEFKRCFKPEEASPPDEDWSDCVQSIDARGRDYAPPEELIKGFLTPGLTVLSASPKAGKTWLVHEFCLAAATGGNAIGVLPCIQSESICLFLEDSERRGILRERALAGHDDGVAGVTYCWARSQWTLDRLGRWLDLHPKCRIVAIDTAERWKQMQPPAAVESTGRIYSDDYKFWGELQTFSTTRNIALVLLHHDRKPNGSSGNILDTVSGTRGITGSADHVWILDRNRQTGVSKLQIVGRDLDAMSIEFSRDPAGQLRAMAGAPVLDTVSRIDMKAQARQMYEDGMSLAAVGKVLGVSKAAVAKWSAAAGGWSRAGQ